VSMQVADVRSGSSASAAAHNVIPASVDLLIDWRYPPSTSFETIVERTHALAAKHCERYAIETFEDKGRPFLGQRNGELVGALRNAIGRHVSPSIGDVALSTGGGTSDARFVAQHFPSADIAEFGPLNATIHKANESVSLRDLITLTRIYESVFEQLLY
jgi:succinyl-diaminopimelate desuccinylase